MTVKLKQVLTNYKYNEVNSNVIERSSKANSVSACVYQYNCVGGRSYIGYTSRHLLTHVDKQKNDVLGVHHIQCNQSIATFRNHFISLCTNITNSKKLLTTEAIYIKIHRPALKTMHNTNTRQHTLKMI